MVLVFCIPPVSGMIVFAVSTFTSNPLNAVLSFTIMSLFNTMRFPLVMLPKSLRGTSGVYAGVFGWGGVLGACVKASTFMYVDVFPVPAALGRVSYSLIAVLSHSPEVRCHTHTWLLGAKVKVQGHTASQCAWMWGLNE